MNNVLAAQRAREAAFEQVGALQLTPC